jgi:hypothetical protein
MYKTKNFVCPVARIRIWNIRKEGSEVVYTKRERDKQVCIQFAKIALGVGCIHDFSWIQPQYGY